MKLSLLIFSLFVISCSEGNAPPNQAKKTTKGVVPEQVKDSQECDYSDLERYIEKRLKWKKYETRKGIAYLTTQIDSLTYLENINATLFKAYQLYSYDGTTYYLIRDNETGDIYNIPDKSWPDKYTYMPWVVQEQLLNDTANYIVPTNFDYLDLVAFLNRRFSNSQRYFNREDLHSILKHFYSDKWDRRITTPEEIDKCFTLDTTANYGVSEKVFKKVQERNLLCRKRLKKQLNNELVLMYSQTGGCLLNYYEIVLPFTFAPGAPKWFNKDSVSNEMILYNQAESWFNLKYFRVTGWDPVNY